MTMNITNNAIAHGVLCNFTPSYENGTLPRPLRCTGGKFNEITLDVSCLARRPLLAYKWKSYGIVLRTPRPTSNRKHFFPKPNVVIS